MCLLRRFKLALLALCLGSAGAQQIDNGVNCTAVNPNPAMIRAEGLSELVGDLLIQCFGQAVLPGGAAIPQVNISVSVNTPITSRILDPFSRASEALLLVNEPGSGVPPAVTGYGPAAPQILCPTPIYGCTEYVGFIGSAPVPVPPGVPAPPAVQAAPNVFQGVQTGPNQVTFFGIPLAPSAVLAGAPPLELLRIVNLRTNPTALPPPNLSSPTPAMVMAAISIIGPGGPVPLVNPAIAVAFSTRGFLATTAINGWGSCAPGMMCPLGTVRFTEQFPSAAKTRLAYSGYGAPMAPQNTPGIVLSGSESGFFAPALGTANPAIAIAGLADFGSRLKAVIQPPPGVRLWVGTTNNPFFPMPDLHAALTATEAGPFNPLPATTTWGGLALSELPVVNGTSTAVWEVLGTNPAQLEFFEFPIFATGPSGIPQAAPWTARGSLAPTADQGAFGPEGGSAHGSDYPIPRFIQPPAILLPAGIAMAPGQLTTIPLALSAPTGPAGVDITLTSLNPSVATVVPDVYVFGGATMAERRGALATGRNFGFTMITAAAPGYDSGTVAVFVTLEMSFSPTAITVSPTSRQPRPLLTLSAPAPPGGLTITLSSGNPSVASVSPSVYVPEGNTAVPVPVTAVGTGGTVIRASAPPFIMDAMLPVVVTPSP